MPQIKRINSRRKNQGVSNSLQNKGLYTNTFKWIFSQKLHRAAAGESEGAGDEGTGKNAVSNGHIYFPGLVYRYSRPFYGEFVCKCTVL